MQLHSFKCSFDHETLLAGLHFQNCIHQLLSKSVLILVFSLLIAYFIVLSQSFQNELLSHQKGVDAVTTAGKHLIKLLDDHVYVRPQVDELNQLWKCVNQLAVEKERSLRKALEVRFAVA